MEYPQGYFRQVIGFTMLLQLEKRVDALEQGAGIGEARAGISSMTHNEADNGRKEGVNSSFRPRQF